MFRAYLSIDPRRTTPPPTTATATQRDTSNSLPSIAVDLAPRRPECSSKREGIASGDVLCPKSLGSSRQEIQIWRGEIVFRLRQQKWRQLDKLDFMTAAKILFTGPPKKKKFGIDFHLVQLFFACMPSLAVYLVAQYARYEIRRMEAELEQKKLEEEKKSKEMEIDTPEEKKADSEKELSQVKVRLDKLEEAVKDIVVEAKKQSGGSSPAKQEHAVKKEIQLSAKPSTAEPEPGKPVVKINDGKEEGGGSASVPVSS
ncbi:hypothetical protein NL676_006918 [Syzygium grande]|nr:hypothetical protein NL676_006918 [Syzygium grande]